MSNRNKKQYEKIKEQEWIEMEDLRDPQNQSLSRKFAMEQGKKYEQHSYPVNPKPNPNSRDQIINNRPIQTVNAREKLDNKQNQRQLPPKIQKRSKKPSIPMMLVTCQHCTVSQNVPGSTQLYTCGSCQNMNECEPLYGVFNCGNCQAKVCYGFGISVMIKCPKCKSINKVPAEPIKKYESGPNPRQQRQRQKKEKRYIDVEREREQNLRYEGFNKPQYQFIENKNKSKVEEEGDQFRYPGID